MVAEYSVERNPITGQAKMVIPAMIRDSKKWKGVARVTMEPCEDVDGPFLKIRPVVA